MTTASFRSNSGIGGRHLETPHDELGCHDRRDGNLDQGRLRVLVRTAIMNLLAQHPRRERSCKIVRMIA
jgi:hypothetical protein